mmetsp:Transcript_21328/g.61658  ORF Transcript_21328/g.61658 Transcript_21328/m.61658 type:complete len:323 (-) Transcript_21328:829-1797(-)
MPLVKTFGCGRAVMSGLLGNFRPCFGWAAVSFGTVTTASDARRWNSNLISPDSSKPENSQMAGTKGSLSISGIFALMRSPSGEAPSVENLGGPPFMGVAPADRESNIPSSRTAFTRSMRLSLLSDLSETSLSNLLGSLVLPIQRWPGCEKQHTSTELTFGRPKIWILRSVAVRASDSVSCCARHILEKYSRMRLCEALSSVWVLPVSRLFGCTRLCSKCEMHEDTLGCAPLYSRRAIRTRPTRPWPCRECTAMTCCGSKLRKQSSSWHKRSRSAKGGIPWWAMGKFITRWKKAAVGYRRSVVEFKSRYLFPCRSFRKRATSW